MKDSEIGYLIYRMSVIICFVTIMSMSTVIEPIVNYLKLTEEADAEEPSHFGLTPANPTESSPKMLESQEESAKDEDGLWSTFLRLLDTVFLRHPRNSMIALSAKE